MKVASSSGNNDDMGSKWSTDQVHDESQTMGK